LRRRPGSTVENVLGGLLPRTVAGALGVFPGGSAGAANGEGFMSEEDREQAPTTTAAPAIIIARRCIAISCWAIGGDMGGDRANGRHFPV
jgi:hypothetical protein